MSFQCVEIEDYSLEEMKKIYFSGLSEQYDFYMIFKITLAKPKSSQNKLILNKNENDIK